MSDIMSMKDNLKKNPAWVAEGLINAIKAMEVNQKRERPQSELAMAAYDKLQFDFPDVLLEELQGLAAELRSSLNAKAGVCPYYLTDKFVENITEAACYSQVPAPPSSFSNVNMPSSSNTPADSKTHSASSGVDLSQPQPVGVQQEKSLSVAASLQLHPSTGPSTASRIVYQQLCGVVLLDWTAKLLSLPEEAAWQLLSSFHADEPLSTACDTDHDTAPMQSQSQPETSNPDDHEKATREASASAEEVDTISHTTGSGMSQNDTIQNEGSDVNGVTQSSTVYEEVIAEEQDDDDMPYEDIPFAPSHTSGTASSLSTSVGTSQLLPQRMQSSNRDMHSASRADNHTSTSGRLDFSNLNNGIYSRQNKSFSSYPPLSLSLQQSGAYSWAGLKRKLTALASHTRYSVMSERELWAHGSHIPESVMVVLRTLGAHSRASELQDVMSVYVQLVTERLLDCPSDMKLVGLVGEALGVGAASDASADVIPLRCPPDQSILSPELVMMLTMLSQLASRITNPSHRSLLWDQVNTHFISSVHTGFSRAERAGESHPDALNSLSLLSSVMEFYATAAPRTLRERGLELGARGTLRLLSALFARHGAQPSAEALRRCVLLCAAGSSVNLKWLAAVPSLQKTLQDSYFNIGSPGEAHSILWELLTKAGDSPRAAAVLDMVHVHDQVLRPLRLLELLCKCQSVQPYGQRMWSGQLHARMQQVFNELQKGLTTSPHPDSTDTSASGASTQVPHTIDESASAAGSSAESALSVAAAAAESVLAATTSAESAPGVGTNAESAPGVGTSAESAGEAIVEGEEKSVHAVTAEEMREKVHQRVLPACWKLLKELLLQVDVVKKD